MIYINMKQSGKVETVDQFETYREARAMLTEYRQAFHDANLYLSQRATKEWGRA